MREWWTSITTFKSEKEQSPLRARSVMGRFAAQAQEILHTQLRPFLPPATPNTGPRAGSSP